MYISSTQSNIILLPGTGNSLYSIAALPPQEVRTVGSGNVSTAGACATDKISPAHLTSTTTATSTSNSGPNKTIIDSLLHPNNGCMPAVRALPVPILPHPASLQAVMPQSQPSRIPTTVGSLTVTDHHNKAAIVPESVLSPAATDHDSTSSDADSIHNDSAQEERGGQMQELQDDFQANGGNSSHIPSCGSSNSSLSESRLSGLENGSPQDHNEDEMDILCGGGRDKDHSGDCRLLWEFIYQLLQERGGLSQTYVCWENGGVDLVFRIVHPTGLAELWGHQKNRSNMTYEKLSRALRYYYKMNIIKKVPGKRLTYKFLQHPTKIQKGQRGAKPHSMRNLPQNKNPPLLAPVPSPLPPNSSSPRASPVDSRPPPSLSPPINDDRRVPSPLPRPGSRASLSPHCAVTHSQPSTPMFHSAHQGSNGSPPGVDERVRTSLKDHLQRTLVQGKLAEQELIRQYQLAELRHNNPHLSPHPLPPELQLQERLLLRRGADRFESKMDCDDDYQEEPEDLTVPRKDESFARPLSVSPEIFSSISPPFTRNPLPPHALPPPPRLSCRSPPTNYSPGYSPNHYSAVSPPSPVCYPPAYSPALVYRSLDPRSAKAYVPSPPRRGESPAQRGRAEEDTDDEDSNDHSAASPTCLVVPSVTKSHLDCGFAALSESAALRNEHHGMVKTEPLQASVS